MIKKYELDEADIQKAITMYVESLTGDKVNTVLLEATKTDNDRGYGSSTVITATVSAVHKNQ